MFGRLFKRFKKSGDEAGPVELPVERTTIGLCFDYQRGLDYGSEYLENVGLDHVLKTLMGLNLRATFFCPARLCETAPDQLGAIAAAGHEMAALGYADESPRDLTDDALKQLVFACRNAFAKRGLSPVGFKSPQSHWDRRLCAELSRQQFLYDAEHDHAKQLYVLVPGAPPLVRVPIRTDDRGLRRSEDTYDATVSKHMRAARKAIQQRHFVAVCFHPWILAEDMERMEHWQAWVQFGVKAGARMVALEDALPVRAREPGGGGEGR